jgi:hypothetical protein
MSLAQPYQIDIATGRQGINRPIHGQAGRANPLSDQRSKPFDPMARDFGSTVLAGVMAKNGAFYPATITSRDSTGAALVMTVPTEMPLFLWLASKTLRFQMSNGKTWKPTDRIPVVIMPGVKDQTISVTLVR